jgi:hypothetical protein
MSDQPHLGFGKFVPGFDFLQNLAKGASQTLPQMPNLSSWIAPTLNVEELDKRIGELKAVNFWLDQNSKALGATIQALEVQKMTLATLKGMNFNMSEMANALKLNTDAMFGGMQKMSEKAAEAAGSVASAATRSAAKATATPRKTAAKPRADAANGPAAGASVVDPMQWWGALTQQFQQIASSAMKDVGGQAAMETARAMTAETLKAADAMTKAATGASHAKARKTPARRTAAKKARS